MDEAVRSICDEYWPNYNLVTWLYRIYKDLYKVYVPFSSLSPCFWPKTKHQKWRSCVWSILQPTFKNAGQPNSRMRGSAVVAFVLRTRRACTSKSKPVESFICHSTLQLETKKQNSKNFIIWSLMTLLATIYSPH